MTDKRRKVVRVRTAIPAEWGVTPHGYPRGGKIVSLSNKGCLIRTDHVEPLYGKTVYLRFPLPDDEWMALQGEVIYYLRDVGFALEFSELNDKDNYLLSRLVQDYHRGDPYKPSGAAPPLSPARSDADSPRFNEQRKEPRVKLLINVNWGTTPDCEYSGDKVTSISLGGCFVQTERAVGEGNAVYVRLWEMPGGRGVFRGVVRYVLQLSPKHAPIGLGVEFAGLSDEESASLREVLNFYGETLTT